MLCQGKSDLRQGEGRPGKSVVPESSESSSYLLSFYEALMTVWPSGLRRWLKAPFRKGVGSNPTAVKWRAAQITETLRRCLR